MTITSATKTTKATGVRLTRVVPGFYSYRGKFTYRVINNATAMIWMIEAKNRTSGKVEKRLVAVSLREARQMIASMEAAS